MIFIEFYRILVLLRKSFRTFELELVISQDIGCSFHSISIVYFTNVCSYRM